MSLCHWQRPSLRGNEHIAMRRCRFPSTRISPTQFTPNRAGFTLIEVLAATALALLMMGTLVSMFAIIGDSIGGSRSTIELTERLRATQLTLQSDLAGITGGKIAPTRDPEKGEGYFGYIEGPIGPVMSAFELGEFPGADPRPDTGDEFGAAITDEGFPDTTVGDFDDVIMFTTRRSGDPFVGRADTRWAPSGTIESPVAEVCWFLRGTTLYRRQLLVMPSLQRALDAALAPLKDKEVDNYLSDFYARNDLSVHMEGGDWDTRSASVKPPRPTLVLNSLGDLTKREHRYGHQPFAFPHDARFWGPLGLPTLRDCCIGTNTGSNVWPFPYVYSGNYELLENHHKNRDGTKVLQRWIIAPSDLMTWKIGGLRSNHREVWQVLFHEPGNTRKRNLAYARNLWADNDPALSNILRNLNHPQPQLYANDTTRVSDDVILTNVISFDVEVWDPGAPIYETQNDSNAYVSIFPGDPAYAAAVRRDMDARDTNNFVPVGYGAFVDLNYMAQTASADLPGINFRMPHYRAPSLTQPVPEPSFHHAGDRGSSLRGTRPSYRGPGRAVEFDKIKASVYDTWSSHYEHDGKNQDVINGQGSNYPNPNYNGPLPELPPGWFTTDQGTNGLDDISPDPITYEDARRNGADDMTEREAPPPYDAPLKAIRIKIRVFEPDSEQIREVTVVQDF